MNRPILDDRFIDNVLNKILEDNLQKRINDLIDEETEKFKMQLLDRKDDYIAEIMKGIRILHEQCPEEQKIAYYIQFENVERIVTK